MSMTKILMGGAALLVLAACGNKDADTAETEIPAVEDVVETAETAVEDAAKSAEELLAESKARSEAFLASYGEKEGVEVSETGLRFRSLVPGEGDAPGEDDFVRIHFIGKTIDGEEVENSYKRDQSVTFPLKAVIPGWQEAVQKMQEGGKAEIVLPPALLLQEGQSLDMEGAPTEAMIFEVELLEVIAPDDEKRLSEIQEEVQAKAMARFEKIKQENLERGKAFLAENKARDGVTVTESGLQYEVLEKGDGAVSPAETDVVEVHYRGTLTDGTEFDSSYARGEPAMFPLNGVIDGWTEGVQLMSEGDKYRFYVPHDLAYGEMGTQGGPIGPNEVLVFDVELIDVKDEEELAALEAEAKKAQEEAEAAMKAAMEEMQKQQGQDAVGDGQ